MSATLSPELEQYRTNCVAAVSEVVSDQVVDAAPFNCRGLYTNKMLGHFGFLPYLLGRAAAKSQAGGLPRRSAPGIATPSASAGRTARRTRSM